MDKMTNHWVAVHGPGLMGYGPFGGPPSYEVAHHDDVTVSDSGALTIIVKPRVTEKGVTVNKEVTFPRGAWTHIAKSTTSKEIDS